MHRFRLSIIQLQVHCCEYLIESHRIFIRYYAEKREHHITMKFMIARSCWSAHFVIFEKKNSICVCHQIHSSVQIQVFFHFYSFLSIFDTQFTTKCSLLCCGIYSQCAVFLESDLPLH